jgi:hypothetical protein
MRDAIAVEALKARRSRLPWLSAAAFAVATLVGAMFMFILQDPDRARSMGLLGTKAELAGGTADWPGYFSLLAQTTAVGGTLIFGIILVWIFGREFSDHTAGLRLTDARAVNSPEAVATVLVQAGCPPNRLVVEQEDLETYFLRAGTKARC